MGKIGLSANINTVLLFMGLNFTESTIETLEHIVASFPKDKLDALSVELWKRLNREDLTEEDALRIMAEISDMQE